MIKLLHTLQSLIVSILDMIFYESFRSNIFILGDALIIVSLITTNPELTLSSLPNERTSEPFCPVTNGYGRYMLSAFKLLDLIKYKSVSHI